MSRTKTGLDYFALDIDFFNDEKIELISAKHGELSELAVIKLLSRIYRQGYYIEWNSNTKYLYSKKFGKDYTFDYLSNIVNDLLEYGFFNKKLFDKFGILTSKGIQGRYVEATRRRKTVFLIADYLLLNDNILGENVSIIELNVDNNPQSKVKESKVKESKEVNTLKEALKKSWYDNFELYKSKYPKRDYNLELEKMLNWIDENQNKAKKKKNWNLFIHSWLNRTPLNRYDQPKQSYTGIPEASEVESGEPALIKQFKKLKKSREDPALILDAPSLRKYKEWIKQSKEQDEI